MTEAVDAAESGVVVGADGSDHGIAALRWAAGAAVAYGLPLTVLHARPDHEAEPELVDEPTGVLGAAVALAREARPGLEVRALQMPDSPVQSLLAAGENADVLVLGSRGVEGFRGLLLGSTTMHVTPYAQCPVVVVHSGMEGGVPIEEFAASSGNRGQVVLGYDGSSASNRGIRCTLVPIGRSSSISTTRKVPSALPVHSTAEPPRALRERITMESATMKQLSRPMPNWPR